MRSSAWKKLLFPSLPLIVLLVGLEGFQRIRLFVKSNDPRFLYWGVNVQRRLVKPDLRKIPLIGFEPGKNVLHGGRVFRVNNLGMIGNDVEIQKPKGTIRILALAGSAPAGLGLSNAFQPRTKI